MTEPNDFGVPPRDPGLSRLYRSATDEAPPAALDAAILQAARDAVTMPAAPAVAWWKRLLVPAGVAATALFAVMLTLTMERNPPGMAEVLPQKASPPASVQSSPVQMPEAKGRAEQPVAAKEAPQAAQARPAPAVRAEKKMKAEQSQPLARDEIKPQVLPAAPAPLAAPVAQEIRTAPPAARHEQRSDRVEESAERARATSAAPALESAAKRVAPRPEIEWLEEIRQLRRQGRHEEAARRLAEFRAAYPGYTLPDDLK